MRAKLRRIGSLVRRYRVDRRLPPQVLELYRSVVVLRVRDLVERTVASLLPVVGRGDGVERIGHRRVATVDLDASFDRLSTDTAATIEAALSDLDAFVVGQGRTGITIGVPLAERDRALDAVQRRIGAEGWVVRWHDRNSSGLAALDRAHRSRRVARARSWDLFRPRRWGERAVGPEFATTITFWQVGTSGEYELVGTRGHERFHPSSPQTVETIGGRAFRGRAAFPVERDLERFHEPVDIVFTWVDGADPVWIERFRATAAEQGRAVDEVALDPARYRSRDELKYALRSVWAHCGWVRHIWVVTAGQCPSWLDPALAPDRISLVDHAEILPDDYLPTFNSHALEASLHHVPGLGEHFVYFNDDMFVGRPLTADAFFTANGLARVFQSGSRVHGFEDDSTLAVDTAARRGRELLDRRFARVVASKPLHAPYPLRRSTLDEIDREFPEIVSQTRSSRFRSPTDLSVAASFGQHYGLAVAQSVTGEIASEYVHVESARLPWHLDRIRLGDDIDTYCINETSDGIGRPDREVLLRSFFDRQLPVAAPWEHNG